MRVALALLLLASVAGCGPTASEQAYQRKRIREAIAAHELEQRIELQAQIAERETKAELIELLGLPQRCESVSNDLETCLWQVGESVYENRQAYSRTYYGGGVMVHDPGITLTRKISDAMMVQCTVPTDGTARTGDCQVWRE